MKSHDIFSRVDTMNQRDRQTDRRTPGDSKDRAYAQRRAVKVVRTIFFGKFSMGLVCTCVTFS